MIKTKSLSDIEFSALFDYVNNGSINRQVNMNKVADSAKKITNNAKDLIRSKDPS
jgi:hypothetical protein